MSNWTPKPATGPRPEPPQTCLHPIDRRVASPSWKGEMCGVCGVLLAERVKEILAELRAFADQLKEQDR